MAPLQCWGTLLAAALEGPKLKSEPKSSMTEEGNPKLNPWLPAAATHVSSGSNDSCYLLKKKKKLPFFMSLLTTKVCSSFAVTLSQMQSRPRRSPNHVMPRSLLSSLFLRRWKTSPLPECLCSCCTLGLWNMYDTLMQIYFGKSVSLLV